MKKKKNSTRLFGFRTAAFALLALGSLAVLGYALWGIVLSLILTLNNQNNTSLMITILALSICMFLVMRFTWFNGNKLWIEWTSRQKIKRGVVDNRDFSHLEEDNKQAESDLQDSQSLYEASTNS